MELSLWLWALILAVLKRPSEAGVSILVRPANVQCACPNDQLRFNCTIVIGEERIGGTIWSGTAFNGCNENRIQVRHSNENAVSECKSGTLSARSFGIVGNCTTSELNVTVDSTLNNKTVQCILNSNSGMSTIGNATIMLMTGPYQQAPGEVTLTDVRPDQLIFNWSRIDPNCPTVQYQNTFDCHSGNCSLATPTSTLANCYNLKLSTTARNCTFSVRSEICGFTGPSSNPITVILKVPDAPQVNLIPVYSSESQALTNLIIEIRSQMEPFSIYEGISGSIVNFTIQNSSGIIKTIPAADCVDSVCKYMPDEAPVCQSSSGDNTISVSAANGLGPGPASQPITVGCTNRFATVDVDLTASILTCRFQNNQNTIQKTCRVVYSVCGQEQVFDLEGNSTVGSPDRVMLQLSLPSGTNCYTYTLTAYDGMSTAMVEGRVNLSDEGSTNVAAIVVPIVIILILIVAVGIVVIVLVIWKFHSRDRKEDYHIHEAQPDSPDNQGKTVSGTKPTVTYYAEHEHADSGEIEPENLHRGESNLSVDKEEQIKMVPENNASNTLDDDIDQDGKGVESADVDQPGNNSTQSRNDSKSDNEYPKIGGGKAFFGYAGDDDDDLTLY